MEYRPSEIEPTWRKWWIDNNTYKIENQGGKPKYYILDMFPYPSGAGLHVGHPLGYIASDILARYKRLRGFNVLHPMGFDSFGLPAEQYAIQTGQHPAITTEQNLTRYREQLGNIGFSFDWSREVRTSDPDFYKWTQWIFIQLFNHYYDHDADKALPISELEKRFSVSGNAGVRAVCDDDTPAISAAQWNVWSEQEQQLFLLKYRITFPGEEYVNWCSALGSVLSNDEVKDGVSERGGHPVERKLMKQWVMRITAYADRLLEGLNTIDWPESIKEQQRNWIGKSVGASMKFTIDAPLPVGEGSGFIEVFTTRVDTIYGATFMVIAPELDLVKTLTTDAQRSDVDGYIKWTSGRSEIERMADTRKATGVFTGSYAINPANGERVPIWIADYVLAGYGTGAVMAVPSGDQRDWNFATAFNLPIVPIMDSQKDLDTAADPSKEGRYINSERINGMIYAEAVPTLIQWLEEKGLGRGKTQYKLRNAVFSRQRYWGEPVPAIWEDGVPTLLDEKELPLVLPSVDKYLPTETGEPPLARAKGWKYELSTMPGWAGSSWYFYRYMDPHNEHEFCSKEARDYWQKVDFYIGGSEHAVGHLLYSRFWNHFLYDMGLVPHREFAQKLVNQGMIQGRSNFVYRAKERFFEEYLWLKVLQPYFNEEGAINISGPDFEEEITYDFAFATNNLVIEVTSIKQMDKIERIRRSALSDGKRLMVLYNEELTEQINEPDAIAEKIRRALASREDYIVSSESPTSEQLFVSHSLLYKYSPEAVTKLHVDVNIVEDDVLVLEKARAAQQFANSNFKLDAEGKYTCSWEVEKMSKSKFNVVNPDDIVAEHGADCFRMFEMFLGPITDAKPWNTKGISGVSGFLRKFWSMFFEGENFRVTDETPTRDELRVLHTCIKKVTDDIERMSMNTCVSHLMIATNDLRGLKCAKRAVLEPLVILIAPFGPHIAEELWHRLGHNMSVCDAAWPIHNEEFLKTDSKEYPIQINGKLRGTIELPTDISAADAEAAALGLELVQKWLNGKMPQKIRFIPGKIISISV
ncbi:MAG: leucine--tRNA ligase [Phycisphaerae bacterium]|nr:leucine--tRNA ligase [Saprospiraceae bacterium]